jgi:Polysaccharide deacetylase
MNISAVPVLYYHSIKYKRKSEWVHPKDILELESFQRHLKFFQLIKTRTHFFDDLQYHLDGNKKLSPNSILLTFDDGYLDNFIFAFPLLKKYNLKATIWVVPDFVNDNDNSVRPTLEDYWNNKISLNELNKIDGYINWEEMRLMEKSGLIDIQSHTLTHARYPASDKIVDFVNPKTKIDWLYWNLYPEDKPFFLTERHHSIPLGYPIYESGKGNIVYKCEENGQLTNEIVQYVKDKESKNFFELKDWKEKLFSLSEKFKSKNKDLYKLEAEEDYIARVKFELSESKKIIEKKLDKKIDHVCWPYGGWNDKTISLAQNCGYLTSTAKGQKNIFNKIKNERIDRIALDNPKYQDVLFYPYASFKLLNYKL